MSLAQLKPKVRYSSEDICEFLSDRHVFDGLDTQELEAVAGLMTVESYDNREKICDEGDPGDEMYFIFTGAIRVILGGKDMDIVLHEGNVVGEMSILDGSPRSATLVADGGTTLRRMAEGEFFGLFRAAPHIGKTILRNLARTQQDRLREMNAKLTACMVEKERLEDAFRRTR